MGLPTRRRSPIHRASLPVAYGLPGVHRSGILSGANAIALSEQRVDHVRRFSEACQNEPRSLGRHGGSAATSAWLAAAHSEYTEQAFRLPTGYLAYTVPEFSPEPTPSPVLSNGSITFGVFQSRAKMNPGVWDAMAEVLRQVPGFI